MSKATDKQPDAPDASADYEHEPAVPMVPVEDATGQPIEVMHVDDAGKIDVEAHGTEIVPIADGDIDTIEKLLTTMRTRAVEDSEEISARIALKKLRARNVDELNALGELRSVEELLNVPCMVDDVHWNESRIAESAGAYVVFDATNGYTGERATFGCGHQDVMITLFKAGQWGLFPARMVFTAAKNPNRFGKPTYLAQILPPEEAS